MRGQQAQVLLGPSRITGDLDLDTRLRQAGTQPGDYRIEALALKLDQVRNGEDTFMALIEGVDDAWEVSLLKFTVEMIQKSHEINIFDFKRKGLL